MISHKHRCIFIHIPKTGGSSIEDVLWPGERTETELWGGFVSRYANKYQTGGLQHLSARLIEAEVGHAVFSTYFKFTFVRNPWDRVVSQFSYMASRADLRELIGMNKESSLREYLALIRHQRHVQWQKQVEFLRNDRGQLMVDFIGRFEQFEKDARVVFAELGVPCERVPHTNASVRRDYPAYFDELTEQSVRDLYAEDIEYFGYEFAPHRIEPFSAIT